MAIRDMLKISRKTFLNPTGWIDYDSLKYRTKSIWDILKGMTTVATPDREETFEQAMERQGLTDADVEQRISTYRLFAIMFVLLGSVVFFYSFYLLFKHSTFAGFLLGIAASAVFLSQAFRYDFWTMQLKERRLGMTFEDWKSHILGIKK